ncbi:hypothetical protein LPTSP3_g26540 [Leptospira kobayashii]|uniref:Lipoprotein n=2 Tax=Leptospira kobayashii TaxID=1917830 RepID=A0ABM7ULJ3_9LEPT|nr:hypothetical protein LPTSP3_g26540 [Leptospira kobayashii]
MFVIMFFKSKNINIVLLILPILLSSFVFACKGENDEDDEDLLLGLASQQNTSVSGLCKNFANGPTFSFDGVNLTSSPQNLIGTSNGNFYAGVLAKGLKANEKIIFNNIAETTTPSINAYSGSVCEISESSVSAAGTLLSFNEDNLTGVRTYTVVTAGDYFFVVSGTTSNVKAITVVLE